MNHITLWAELDLAGDESTWGFMGFMGIMGWRLMNKKVPKGGQTTMLFDVSRRYPVLTSTGTRCMFDRMDSPPRESLR